jgi:hypothetical protein
MNRQRGLLRRGPAASLEPLKTGVHPMFGSLPAWIKRHAFSSRLATRRNASRSRRPQRTRVVSPSARRRGAGICFTLPRGLS